ncbi:MAG TPA: exosortase/archaeosortase family protein [Tepidisphaeraceae bacterium]|jgi:exosortase|nr:exosortase/archaeosortase family protein [Tepidisphaeraceae bacterium]
MSTKPLVTDRLTGWHIAGALLAGAIGVAVTWNAWQEIYMFATRDEEASHIFLVIPVALYMIWVRRMRLRHCRPSGTIIGPIMVAAGWWLSYYGFNYQRMFFYHIGSLIVVLGCMFSVLGKHVLFRFFPAVAVLIFLAPVPGTIRQAIAVPLQSYTAKIAQTLLDVMGVQTELSGNQLSINHIPVTIVEACNGMRMVFPLFLITYAFSFGLPLKNAVRYFVLLMSPLTAIICNVIRTLPLIWLYGNGSKRVADHFHDYSGWLMLPIAFCLLLALIRLLEWMMLPVKRYTLASQ